MVIRESWTFGRYVINISMPCFEPFQQTTFACKFLKNSFPFHSRIQLRNFHNAPGTFLLNKCCSYHIRSRVLSSSAWDNTKVSLQEPISHLHEKKPPSQGLCSDILRKMSTSVYSPTKEPSSSTKPLKSTKVARPRTRKPAAFGPKDEEKWLSTAFSLAEEFHLEHLSLDLQTQGNIQVASLPTDAHDVLHMNVITAEETAEPSEMFIFRNGCLVFWNVPEPMIKKVMKTAAKHQSEPYEIALVNWESEQMNYTYEDGNTRLVKDSIVLNASSPPDVTTLEKFTFSNAMMLSVKLAMWEYMLDKFVSSIEYIPETLKAQGKLKMSHKNTMKHMGKLYSLSHRINLSSDLLNTPDFYWDREELEKIFNKMCRFLSVARRTEVMNEKLKHCHELMDLMRNDVTEQHTLRLEAMITILIGVEILIEISHYTV